MVDSNHRASAAPELAQRVERVFRERGARGAARWLGVDRSTVLAVVAGGTVRRGSLALIRERFRELDRAQEQPPSAA